MPVYHVRTAREQYPCVVQRNALGRVAEFLPVKSGKTFVVTTRDVWELHGPKLGIDAEVLFLPGGEENKRFEHVEALAEQMVARGADRSSVVVAFGGGIAGDMGGFLASIFMRGVPVIQAPTTLLAQVDAAVGGKTGVNLRAGKNLIGTFHQPRAVLIDPEVLRTLPAREYRAGLFEVVKHGVIASRDLFDRMTAEADAVLAQQPEVLDYAIAESVRIKAEVVSADEREGDLRRILNFGHTVGHALESETGYARFLHGEAVAFGMEAATHLAVLAGLLDRRVADAVLRTVRLYGPIPPLDGVTVEGLFARLVSDKKTIQGKVHWVLPDRIGHVVVRSGVEERLVLDAIQAALR